MYCPLIAKIRFYSIIYYIHYICVLQEWFWVHWYACPAIHTLSLELFICMCSNKLVFLRCSFSSSSKVFMFRLWIWSSSYMAFRAVTVFRSPLPGKLASIHGEKPSEESSCVGDADTDHSCVERRWRITDFLHKLVSKKKKKINQGSNNT